MFKLSFYISLYFSMLLGPITGGKQDTIPTIFLIGEHITDYEKLNLECSNILMTAFDGSMEMAFDSWTTMLIEMEEFSEKKSFDLRGLKLWINAYWNADGTLKHIAYYPKPTSRNIDFQELTIFFDDFASQYQMTVDFDQCYAHSGSASFPTFQKFINKKAN